MNKVLITGASHFNPEQIEQFSALGCNVIIMPNESDELPVPPEEVEIVICNGLFLYHDITLFSALRLIQLTSAGLDRVPLDYIQNKGIQLFNARGVYSIPMAEWAVGRILEYYKHFRYFNQSQLEKSWNKDRGIKEINGTQAAIIGAGNIGQEVAKRLSAFGSIVTGYDVILGERPFFNSVLHINTLSSEIGDYDIIVLTAPYTPETHHIISKEIISSLRKDAILVNIARGGLVDTDALLEVFNERNDLFAALDVFEEEPLASDNPLWGLSNVALSPHNSFVSAGNNERLFKVVYQNIKQYVAR